jgi:hypothetical protein
VQSVDETLSFTFKRAQDTAQIGMSIADVVHALHHNGEFFIQFFLGDELSEEVPKFHVESWEYLTSLDISKFALALPRGHAKTTLAKLAVVWYLLFSDVRFVVYLSNTLSVAVEACIDVVNYMRTENFELVFGPLDFDVEQQGKGFYKFTLRYIDETGQVREKFCILKAYGAGQQIRGLNIDNTRPQLAVVDDLESDENTATQAMILKLRTWFYGPFFKALANRNKLVYLGNMLSSKSLLYLFCEKSDDWASMRFGCIRSSGEPLWPEMWPIDKIRADFIEYQRAGLAGRWFAEMMNMPIADGNLLIASEDIYYVPPLVPGEQEAAFITIDCAISQKTWADNTAIAVHALKNGLWRTTDKVVGKFTPDQIFWLLVEMCHKWNTRVVGMQQAAFEMAFQFLFSVLMQTHNERFEIVTVAHGNKSKYERIAVWCSLIRKKQWALEDGEYAITEQLLMFDPAKENNEDDLIDSCAMAAVMIDIYLPSIMDNHTMSLADYRPRLGAQVCRI